MPAFIVFLLLRGAQKVYSVTVMRLSLVVVLFASTLSASDKVPSDAWRVGTLRDSSESWHSRTVGTVNGVQNPTSGNLHGMMVSREYPMLRYFIETPDYIYEAELTLRHKHDKPPIVTVNGPVKFAIVKSDCFIQDEQGDQFKMTLIKKILKPEKTASEDPK